MKEIINVCNLKKDYEFKGTKYTALKDINLTIFEGEFVGIMGPSGSGKTTLLNVMSTIDIPTSGKIFIDNTDLSTLQKTKLGKFRRDIIGFVFQDFNLLDNMTIRDNIALPLTLNNVNSKIILDKIDEITNVLGINSQLDKYPYQLSGGQKQRSAVSRALITSPKIIFADEPTGALDSKSSSELLECLKNVVSKFKTTVVMVTHDAVAASFCDKVMFLKDGVIHDKLVSSGDTKQLYKDILNKLSKMEV